PFNMRNNICGRALGKSLGAILYKERQKAVNLGALALWFTAFCLL
ncbi:MAG: hypothetical protein K0S07_1517, partial [Chlamydiales bacterium]|nr:hypothetical protein [Chlamydiales bacterium]